MTDAQKLIKLFAMGLAIILAVAIIFGIGGTIGMLFGLGSKSNSILENSVNIDISQDITSLDFDISCAELRIIEGDRFELTSNIKDLRVGEKDGELSIEQKQRIVSIRSEKAGEVVLTVPKDTCFKYVEVDAGAGDIHISELVSDKLSLNLGAGRVSIDHIEIRSVSEIEAGAGQLIISDGRLCNLDLDLGVGQADIKAAIEGRSQINCGVGDTRITICGDKKDYALGINTSIGSVEVDGERVTGNCTIGNGKNVIDVDGGVGSIEISFE